MTQRFPPAPPTGTQMLAARPSADARTLLALRRSAGKATLAAPGPTGAVLDEILAVALRVPDHRRVEPWRLLVFEDGARAQFGEQIAEIFARQTPDASQEDLAAERARLLRAPTVVAVISAPDKAHKTPVWEQELSAGAVCQTLLLAANAVGFAGAWLTEWLAYDAAVAGVLGLAEGERIAGFLYLGTATANPPERPRPDTSLKVTRWAEELS